MATAGEVSGPETHVAAHMLVCRVAWWFLERAPKPRAPRAPRVLPESASKADQARALIEDLNEATRASRYYAQTEARPMNAGYPSADNAPWHATKEDWGSALKLLRKVGWKKGIEAAVGFVSLNCRLKRFDVRLSDVPENLETYANDGRATLVAHRTHLHDARTDKANVAGFRVISLDRVALVPSWADHPNLPWVVLRIDLLPDPMAPYLGEPVARTPEVAAQKNEPEGERTHLRGLEEIEKAVTERTGKIFGSHRRLKAYLEKNGVSPASTGAKGTPVTLARSALERLPRADPPTGVGTRQKS